jgi:diacylglycerol O-acyltransferase
MASQSEAAMTRHLDRLSGADAYYLVHEAPMENFYGGPGFVFLFAGECPTFEDFVAHVGERVPALPRLRQKMLEVPFGLARPVWCDDPDFRLDYHVSYAPLPPPGTEEGLQRLVSHLFSEQLDRNKPLWRMWLVPDIGEGRFAVIFKTHHSVGDGVSFGRYFTEVILGGGGVPFAGGGGLDHFPLQSAPAPARLLLRSLADGLGSFAAAFRRLALVRRQPLSAARGLASGALAVFEALRNMAGLAPVVAGLNPSLSAHREITWTRVELERIMRVRAALGGTANDVLLAIVAGAMRGWFLSHALDPTDQELKLGIAVSTRSDDDPLAELGNKMSGYRASLPLGIADPETRYREIRDRMAALKISRQVQGAVSIQHLDELVPYRMLRSWTSFHGSPRLFNLIASNIRGPARPLQLLGQSLTDILPINLLVPNQALIITLMSFNGTADITLVGDHRAMRDIGKVRDMLVSELRELERVAEQRDGVAASA